MKEKLLRNLKRRLKLCLILVSIITVFWSCSAPEYIPTMVNTPMFNNRGEFQATIATGTSDFDAQIAYSVTNHLGFMVNGSYGNNTNDSTDEFHKHTILEGGIGYYEKINRKGRIEIFGGYGFGEVKGYEESFTNSYADARFKRFFIQPAIGISSTVFDGSFAPRVCFVSLESDEYTQSGYKPFFEPTITAKVGYQYIKMVMQFGLSVPLGSSSDEIYFDYKPFIFNVGLHFNLGRRWSEL